MGTAITVRDLHVGYRAGKRSVEAVRGLNFEVQPGEVVGFLGPNGAGKSSTLKALMGFVAPTSGTAEVFGKQAGTEAARAMVGYLPEVGLYYPYLTPLETLTLYGELQGIGKRALAKEARDLLVQVGLADAALKPNRSLSKGMLQRVGIAQALLGNPKLLVLDEFTSGLDPLGRREMRDILLARRAQGTTIFFSSHELSEVEMLCDRVLLVHRGRLVEEQEVLALRESLAMFALEFEASASMVGLTNDLEEADDGVVRARFPEKALLLAAIERVRASGGTIRDVVAREGSLEDYFIDTIHKAA